LFLPYQPNYTRSNLNLILPNPTRPDLNILILKVGNNDQIYFAYLFTVSFLN